MQLNVWTAKVKQAVRLTTSRVRATPLAVDVEAFKAGEPEALAAVVDRCGPWVWALARRGFVCEETIAIGSERASIRVLGAPSPDIAEETTVHVLTTALVPDAREGLEDETAVDSHILEVARTELFRAAERAGRLLSLSDPAVLAEVPAEVEDLDTLMAVQERPSLAVLPLESEEQAGVARVLALRDAFIATLDERSRSLVEARFEGAASQAELARRFDCGTAAVSARERRVRRTLQRTLQNSFQRKFGPREAEVVLSGRMDALLPPTPTWEHIRRSVLTRTFRKEPASYGRRLAWGLLALGLGFGGWFALYMGYLPSVEDDVYPTPSLRVVCSPVCVGGARAQVAVLAPRDARRFGVALRSPDGKVEPLLVAPDGGSLRLPVGAQTRSLVVPHDVRLPDLLMEGTAAIAVFSEDKLRSRELLELAAGQRALPGVMTTTVAVGP